LVSASVKEGRRGEGGRGEREAVTYKNKKRHVPPGRGLFVFAHKFHVNIGLFTRAAPVLRHDPLAVVEDGVDNKR
jgi:hypothetical protein